MIFIEIFTSLFCKVDFFDTKKPVRTVASPAICKGGATGFECIDCQMLNYRNGTEGAYCSFCQGVLDRIERESKAPEPECIPCGKPGQPFREWESPTDFPKQPESPESGVLDSFKGFIKPFTSWLDSYGRLYNPVNPATDIAGNIVPTPRLLPHELVFDGAVKPFICSLLGSLNHAVLSFSTVAIFLPLLTFIFLGLFGFLLGKKGSCLLATTSSFAVFVFSFFLLAHNLSSLGKNPIYLDLGCWFSYELLQVN